MLRKDRGSAGADGARFDKGTLVWKFNLLRERRHCSSKAGLVTVLSGRVDLPWCCWYGMGHGRWAIGDGRLSFSTQTGGAELLIQGMKMLERVSAGEGPGGLSFRPDQIWEQKIGPKQADPHQALFRPDNWPCAACIRPDEGGG